MDKIEIVSLENFSVLLEASEVLDLVYLSQVHLPLDHSIPGFQNVFRAQVIIDLLRDWPLLPICFHFYLGAMRLVLL